MQHIISFDQQKFFYKTRGEKGAIPVVLMPGFAIDHTLWGKFLDLLAQQYYVILIDYRGIGLNATISFPSDITVIVNDITAILEHESLESAHIVAHSMGGYIAQYVAHQNPSIVKTLFLMSTFNRKFSNQTWSYKALVEFINHGIDRKTLITNSMPWLYSSLYMDNEQHCLDHIQRMENREFPPTIETILSQIQFMNSFDASYFSNELKTKTMIIGSDEDRIIPEIYFHRLAKILPNAKLTILPDTGHMTYIEKPQEVVELFTNFIINDKEKQRK